MYPYLLIFHSFFRWLVLLSLLYSIFRAWNGWQKGRLFEKTDEKMRHVTATIAHIQLAIGYVLYFQSPLVIYFRANYAVAVKRLDFLFFGMIHISLMTVAVVMISIGSSAAKRKSLDADKFKVMTCWFIAALILIFIAIPWPFSPLARRALFRY